MAKGKSLVKNKRDESTSVSKSTTRRMQKAAPAPSVPEKKVKAPVRKRSRKSNVDEVEAPEPTLATAKKTSRKIEKTKSPERDKSSLVKREVPESLADKSASKTSKNDKPVKRASRKNPRELVSENLEAVKKTGVSRASGAKPSTRRAKTAEANDESTEKTTLDAKTGGRRAKKNADAPDLAETRGKAKSAKRATVVETTKSENKPRRGRRSKESEPIRQESNEVVDVAEEKSKVKRSRRRAVEPEESRQIESTPEAETSGSVKRRARHATKKNDAVVDENSELDDAQESVDLAKKKRRQKSAESAEEKEKAENKQERGVKRSRKQTVDEEADESDQTSEPDDDVQGELDSEYDVDSSADDNDSDDDSENDVLLTREGKTRSRAAKEKSSRTSRALFTKQSPDYLQLSVVNSFWLCAQWIVSESNLNRVRSAMGRLWHTAEPNLRVYRVDKNAQYTTMRRVHIADLPVQLPVRVWYVPVDNPPSAFAVELGYLSRDNEFFTLSSSGVVETSARFINDPTPLPPPLAPHWGVASSVPYKSADLASSAPEKGTRDDVDLPLQRAESKTSLNSFSSVSLKVGAQIVVKGRVSPGAILKIRDERIVPKPDGVFAVRLELPERRHVFPVVASSYDGSETQTIILAIDRNTKTLETVFRDDDD